VVVGIDSDCFVPAGAGESSHARGSGERQQGPLGFPAALCGGDESRQGGAPCSLEESAADAEENPRRGDRPGARRARTHLAGRVADLEG
jgi:hypothetical protein